MLRTNLASRPFYNDRAVQTVIALGVVIVAALTAFNVAQIFTLNDRNTQLAATAEGAEARANQLRDQARQIRQTLNADDVATMQSAAREANMLIERRAFSWTDLFNRFEATLPPDVRIAAVQPQVDNDGRMLVVVTVFSRRVEDLEAFIDQLEQTRAFRGVISRQDDPVLDGTTRSVLQGFYDPNVAPTAAVPAPAASDSNGQTRGNTPPPSPSVDGGER